MVCLRVFFLFLFSSLFFFPVDVYGQSAPPPERPKVDENGVDVQSGDIYFQEPGVSIGGESVGALSYARFLSGGWRTNFTNALDIRIEAEYNIYSRSMSYGGISRSEYSNNMGQMLPLLADGHDWDSLRDGTSLDFSKEFVSISGAQQQYINFIKKVTFPNGVVYTFHYKDSTEGGIFKTRVQSITSNAGYQLKFNYFSNERDPSSPLSYDWERVVSVVAINNSVDFCDPSADFCNFSMNWPVIHYGSSSTTPPGMGEIRYERGAGYFRIYNPDGSINKSYNTSVINTICIAYNCPGGSLAVRVTSATLGGVTTNYTYSNDQDRLSVMSSTAGVSRRYISDRDAGGITYFDGLGRQSRFDENLGNVEKAVNPEGDYFLYTRDGRGNIITERHFGKGGGQVYQITREFPQSCVFGNRKYCNNPQSVTDAAGNRTSYTYSAEHGGVVTEMGPAVNGLSPLVRRYYQQRYAWIRNGGGSLVRAASPVWLLSEERTCRNGATVNTSCASGASDEVVTTYDYGSDDGAVGNNLALRSKVVRADGVSLRSCYEYDALGNLIAETSPLEGLASCS